MKLELFFIFIFNYVLFVFPAVDTENTDQASVRCYYRFSQKNKTSNVILKDTLTLDIGSQMSRYYDHRKVQEDSVFLAIISNLDDDRINSISIIKKDVEPNYLDGLLGDTYRNDTYNGISEQIYKNRKTGNIVMLNISDNISGERYKGTDPIGTLNWTITTETAVILNYPCQKAKLRFRGRNYEAWFSPKIPINDGPWKFFGLPGLILKVTDSEGIFDFECIGLEYPTTPRTVDIPDYKYFEYSRKDYNKIISKKGGGQIININNGNITIVSIRPDSSFYPIELE